MNLKLILALTIIYIVWGSTYFAIYHALDGGFTPYYLGAFRFLIAGSLMFLYLRYYKHYPAPKWSDWRNNIILSIFLLVLGNGLVNYAEQYVSSSITAVAISSSALWIAFFASLRGEKISGREKSALLIGFLGVVLLNLGGELKANALALLALILSPIAWSMGTILGKKYNSANPFLSASMQMLSASVIMFIVAICSGEKLQIPNQKALFSFFYLLIFGSIIAYSAYIWLVHNARAIIVGSYAYINPVVAIIIGVFIGQERLNFLELIAMLIIILGVLLLSFSKKKPKKK